MSKTVETLGKIPISVIMAAPDMLEALEELDDIVDGLRFGRIWSRDNVEVIQAQLKAKAAIRLAKGESQ